ncbi:MAG: hypothetical protein D6685_18720 [Bacteroidetes bacterium]|nr:hypothetical protein AWN76_008365 [Rhodothermaceae bacterium RA]RMH49894.1 MAG: hypothetical protein D6685_18720 [Bacteroidota bacterium]
MKLEGEYTLPGRPEELFDRLQDPDVLVAAIPGCERFERLGDDTYRGVVQARLGPVQSVYTTTFRVHDMNPPHSYRLRMEGQGPGGFVQADVLMELIPQDGDHTTLRYSGEAQVGGKIARLGQRLVQAGAGVIINKGFNDLRKRILEDLDADGATAT